MRRFFVYFAKQDSRTGKPLAAVHWCGKCYTVKNLEIRVPCHTKMRKTSPKMSLTGKASRFYLMPDDTAILE